MDLPPFVQTGSEYPWRVLPPGAYPIGIDEMKARFSGRFPASRTQERLCEGLAQWLAEVRVFGIDLTIWVNGSFVEEKPDPDDIDLWSFCRADDLRRLDSGGLQAFTALVGAREQTKPRFGCHAFLWANYPADDSRSRLNESVRLEALRTWGMTRPYDKASGLVYQTRAFKGFVVLTIGTSPPIIPANGVWP